MSYQHPVLRMLEEGPGKWLNRRATVRYRCAPATVGKVFPNVREDFYRVWVLDLSRGGAGIILAQTLPTGEEITLQISCPSGNKKLTFAARVAHTAEQANGDWLIGLEFLRPLTDEELDYLLN